MMFPKGFKEKYELLFGSEANSFFMSFEKEAVSAFRINPLKESQKSFPDAIPNTRWGFYGKISGKSPEHVTGLVYSQEPAAQMVAQIAGIKKGMKVLDLAAAPGGKSTHILSYLDNEGLLVANEINGKRAKVLVENIERFGARNVMITNESAQQLAHHFQAYFDVVVLDAPCSGEGMFRKQPDATEHWDKEYPARCAQLQKEILTSALSMLTAGGKLIYSTCTWSPEENEEVVAWFLQQDKLELIDIPKINGMTAGLAFPQTAYMYPHHFKGEGQFVAAFRFNGQQPSFKRKPSLSNLNQEQKALWKEFSQKYLRIELKGMLQTFGQQLYLLPGGLPDLSGLKIARNGLHLGTFKKKRFEPSFALGLALKPSEVRCTVAISKEQFQKYTAGETVALNEDYENGWYQVIVQGNGLGFAKVAGGILKNYFPKGLRFK